MKTISLKTRRLAMALASTLFCTAGATVSAAEYWAQGNPPFPIDAVRNMISAEKDFFYTNKTNLFDLQQALVPLSGADLNDPDHRAALMGILDLTQRAAQSVIYDEANPGTSQDRILSRAVKLHALSGMLKPFLGPAQPVLVSLKYAECKALLDNDHKILMDGMAEALAKSSGRAVIVDAVSAAAKPQIHLELPSREELQKHFAERREALGKAMGGKLILMAGGKLLTRNDDNEYPFRQKSDFLYLTGVEKPDHYLLIDGKSGKSTLFVPRATASQIVWGGAADGQEEAKKIYGVDTAYSDELKAKLEEGLAEHDQLHMDWDTAQKLQQTEAFGSYFNSSIVEVKTDLLRETLDAMRAVKTETEIKLLKFASAVSSLAHIETMRQVRPGMREYEVEAIIEKVIHENGLKHLAYDSIVAAGTNPAVLHYMDNGFAKMSKPGAPMKEGDALLIDAAGEFMGYASDITRTLPAGEKFTDKQKAIYSIVLAAQKAGIEKAVAGGFYMDMYVAALKVIIAGLQDLGILKPGEWKDIANSGAARVFYPHNLSHGLGLDVHDKPNVARVSKSDPIPLVPGIAMTVEPGIYFNQTVLEDPQKREKFKDQIDFEKAAEYYEVGGVRIEDDIVIQKEGPALNLTNVPKEIADIEALRRSALGRR